MKPRFLPIIATARASAFKRRCPSCCAPAGFYCARKNGTSTTYYHSQRSGVRRKPDSPLARWWRAMKPYEGKFARRRPADLVVP